MNHSTRSLPWMIGRMYSSVVGQIRLSLTDRRTPTDSRSRRARQVAEQVERVDLVLEARLGVHLGLVLRHVGELRG